MESLLFHLRHDAGELGVHGLGEVDGEEVARKFIEKKEKLHQHY